MHKFEFILEKQGNDIIVQSLNIEGHAGCKGHPKTIEALVKGRKIEELPIEDLIKTGCNNQSSCGQELAIAIERIKKEYK